MQGGFIRGFLNDGSTDYKSHHSVDSLAFGHCAYSFRNLGRPSRIMLKQSSDSFRVDVDGNLCFESQKIKLPLGYNFGITAASAENPDSFEIFKFVTTTENHTPDNTDPNQIVQNTGMGSPPQNQGSGSGSGSDSGSSPIQNQAALGDIPAYNDLPEAPASQYQSSSEQFADLHNRLQGMMKHINAAHRQQDRYQQQAVNRHDDLMRHVALMENTLEQIEKLRKKVDEVQADVRQTKTDLHNALNQHVAGLRGEVRNTHSSEDSHFLKLFLRYFRNVMRLDANKL